MNDGGGGGNSAGDEQNFYDNIEQQINDYFNNNFENYIDGSTSLIDPSMTVSHTTYTEWQAGVAEFAYDAAVYAIGSEVVYGVAKGVFGDSLLKIGEHAKDAIKIASKDAKWVGWFGATAVAGIDAATNLFDTGIKAGTTDTYYVRTEFSKAASFLSKNQIFIVDIHESGEITVVSYTPWN